MKKAAKGETVRVHYTGTLTDGTVFDSSRERDPLEFTMGNGQLIPGFEQAVDGLGAGEAAKITIPAAEAYGESRDELKITVLRNQVPPAIETKVGERLMIRQQDGGMMDVIIVDVSDTHVVLDANHPLAGQDLTFEIEVVEVK
jgi:peptidylprolyl isomerase